MRPGYQRLPPPEKPLPPDPPGVEAITVTAKANRLVMAREAVLMLLERAAAKQAAAR